MIRKFLERDPFDLNIIQKRNFLKTLIELTKLHKKNSKNYFNILKNIRPDKNGEIQITDALLVQAKRGKVIAYKFKGRRFDCGSVRGYLEATNYFANNLSLSINI